MAENSKIEWTDHTFNPWIGCTRVSPGCDNCYAGVSTPARTMGVRWGAGEQRHRTVAWSLPKRWNDRHAAFYAEHGRRQRVFCASLADVFDNEVDPAWRVDLFRLIRETPHLDWLLLTKRIGNVNRIAMEAGVGSMLAGTGFSSGLPGNVWLGASIVNQEEADRDIPKLLATPARVRFLSMEPLLGPVDLSQAGHGWLYVDELATGARTKLHWVIAGGESGHGARPMHPDWARSLRDQCAAAGVPFLFKQWGEWLPGSQAREVGNQFALVGGCNKGWKWDNGTHSWRIGKKAAGRLLDGVTHDGFPEGR